MVVVPVAVSYLLDSGSAFPRKLEGSSFCASPSMPSMPLRDHAFTVNELKSARDNKRAAAATFARKATVLP